MPGKMLDARNRMVSKNKAPTLTDLSSRKEVGIKVLKCKMTSEM